MKRALMLALAFATATCAAQTAHYLDCDRGSDTGNSLTPATAWRTIAQANAYEFKPGDSLLLHRGARCEGMLAPRGSGTAAAPIRIGAYGQGPLPVIVGGAAPAGLLLDNQQYWEIANLEIIGGSPYGVRIGGSVPLLHHFRITNLVVHDVYGEPATKDSGLIVVAPDAKANTRIDDVVIDGVTAYNTTEWAGIIVNGAGFEAGNSSPHGDGITVRNSIVHDVAGDGILLARVAHGLIEHNVAWNTGMQQTETIGTPDGIWEWMCRDCRVAYNEAFFTDSPGVDGGTFDIDFGNEDNIVEHNFGHDSQGYCLSIFGAEGVTGYSLRSTIRNNTCIHNGRSPRLAKRQGAIYLSTWQGGRLNGFTIENNTVLWEPPLDTAAFVSDAEFTGNLPNRVVNNTIIAASGSFISAKPGIQFEHNRYCAPHGMRPADTTGDLCACMRDWLASSGADPCTEPAASAGPWQLVAVLAPDGKDAAASRSMMTVLASMQHQFAGRGLRSAVEFIAPLAPSEIENLRADWHIAPQIAIDAAPSPYHVPELLLVSPSGKIDARWRSHISPAAVWLRLQSHIGVPLGAQPVQACTEAHP
ncbi:MAG TPA: right-handed parallel beta-helix repeat-containing protein [Terracidiphilus sp.]|nr:right-handed parallel beta-helix repeat-containing protein [Terracidiphilus sp.]